MFASCANKISVATELNVAPNDDQSATPGVPQVVNPVLDVLFAK